MAFWPSLGAFLSLSLADDRYSPGTRIERYLGKEQST
jgi:hypothetical protein